MSSSQGQSTLLSKRPADGRAAHRRAEEVARLDAARSPSRRRYRLPVSAVRPPGTRAADTRRRGSWRGELGPAAAAAELGNDPVLAERRRGRHGEALVRGAEGGERHRGIAERTFVVPVGKAPADRVRRRARAELAQLPRRKIPSAEFLVDVTAPGGPRIGGDSLSASVEARYLFGAPMGPRRSPGGCTAPRSRPGSSTFPDGRGSPSARPAAGGRSWPTSGTARAWWRAGPTRSTPPAARRSACRSARAKGRGARVTVQATVTDINRQAVSSSASILVHPASFYLGARVDGSEWFWKAGTPVTVGVIAVRPAGERVSGVRVSGVIERREWHQVRRTPLTRSPCCCRRSLLRHPPPRRSSARLCPGPPGFRRRSRNEEYHCCRVRTRHRRWHPGPAR